MITKHFSLDEMTNTHLNLPNIPDKYALRNMNQLCNMVLEPIRKNFGKPIIVTSGYRSKQINKLVGGAANSDHCFGAAADIKCYIKDDTIKLFYLICKMAEEDKISCRQIIDEKGYSWVHISINHPDAGLKNNQILHLK